MEMHELEVTLEATLAVARPTPRDVRDALVDYYSTVARPFIARGLFHTQPDAGEPMVRRLLLVRLTTLWGDLSSPWEDPTLDDLRIFRQRIDEYACVREHQQLHRIRRLLDEIVLAASIGGDLNKEPGKSVRTFRVIQGGGEQTPPRGDLHLVPPPAPAASG
jgi:hypothetical protein